MKSLGSLHEPVKEVYPARVYTQVAISKLRLQIVTSKLGLSQYRNAVGSGHRCSILIIRRFVLKNFHFFKSHQAIGDHVVQQRQKVFNLLPAIDYLNDHRKIFRQTQNLRCVQNAVLANTLSEPVLPNSRNAPA